jgi:hypothetical protein
MSGISDMPEMGDLMGGGMPGASDGLMGAFVGPGSQPADADGATLDYMIMPDDMRVFSMATIPDSDLADEHAAGVAAGAAILAALEQVVAGGAPASVDLSHLAPADMAFVDQMLGEGEVSVISGSTFQAQDRSSPGSGACVKQARTAPGAATGWTSACSRRASSNARSSVRATRR